MNVGNCARARMMNPYLSKPQKEEEGVQSAFKLQFEQGMPINGSDISSTGKRQPVVDHEFDQQVDAMVFVPKHQSQGTESLTEDQIDDLKSRYDVKNMTDRELRSLMLELNDRGVLSTEDAVNSQRMEVKVNFHDCQVELVREDSLNYDYSNKLAYFTKLSKLDKLEGNSMERSHSNIAKILGMLV